MVVSGYTDESNSAFGKLPIPEKFNESRKSIERLHPGHGKELEKPMYVGWGRVPYNEGSWIRGYGASPQAPGVSLTPGTGAGRAPRAARTQSNPGYETIIQPDGRIVFAGDHCSHIVAWQEGARGQRAARRAAAFGYDQGSAAGFDRSGGRRL